MYGKFLGNCWYNGMKNDIMKFVPKCQNSKQVKVKYVKPNGLAQELVYRHGWKNI